MARKVRENSTILYAVNNPLVEFSTGQLLPEHFQEPLIAKLDEETVGGAMSTLYMSPAVIGKKAFYMALTEIGINNIEAKQVIIQDNVNDKTYDDYLLLNIIGRVSCADMSKSEYHSLGDGMHIMNTLVIDSSKTQGMELFLVHEDTGCVVVSERVHDHLQSKGYPDLYFEELQQV